MMHVRFTRGLTLPTLAAIAVVVVAVGGMFVALLNGFRAFRDDTRDRSRAGLILSHSHAAQRAVVDVETGLRGYLLVADARFLEPFFAGRRAYGSRFVALERLVTDPAQRVRLRGVRTAVAAYIEDYAVPQRGRGAERLRAELVAAMTEGKRLVEALRAREQDLRVAGDRLQGILDHAATLISVSDRDGRYLLVGRRWTEVSGHSEADALGRTDAELTSEREAAPGRARDLEVIRTGRALEYERDVAGLTYLTVKFPLK